MEHMVEIKGETYSLWINDSPEYYLKKLKEGYFTLDGSKLWGYISKDLHLSEHNISRIIRQNCSTYIHDFEIKDNILHTKVGFEIDLDDDRSCLEHYYEDEDNYESDGSCDGSFYFNLP